jgi:hypothetical protein
MAPTKPIAAHLFKEAGIKGFTPLSPFKVTSHFLMTNHNFAFHWPSLLELNNKIIPFPWSSEEEQQKFLSGDSISTLPVMYTGPPPAAPTYPCPAIPPLNTLTWSIIQSSNKLFFISNSISQNDAHECRLVRWHFKNPCLPTPLVYKTGASSWTSTSAILATHQLMLSTSIICYNIARSASSKTLYPAWTHTLFNCPIRRRTMQHATSYVPLGNGSTSHTSTHLSMGCLSLPQPTVPKHKTASPRLIGTF